MVKLMKYDLRSALRLFVPLWIGALLVSILHTVSVSLSENIPLEAVRSILSVLFVAALVIGMIAVLLLPMIYFVVRFYHSTVKDEGYLTFTLPVSVDAVIWSKVLTGAIVCICSVLVCLLMAVILMWTKLPSLSDIQTILREIIELVNGVDLALIGILYLIAMPVGTMASLLQFFLAIAIGQTANRHKVLLSVGAYFGINMVMSTVSNILLVSTAVGVFENSEFVLQMSEPGRIIWVFLLFAMGLNLILGAVFYIITRSLFKKHLNLA